MEKRDEQKHLKLLGSKIRDIRLSKGLTQAELGFRCDKEQQSVNRLESGGVNPSYIYLLEICEGLGITISELFQNQIKPNNTDISQEE